MKRLSRRAFLETTSAAGVAAIWGLPPAAARPNLTADRLGTPVGPVAESVLQGIAHYVDAQQAPAALLDGDFRVVRTSRSHQLLLNYDPADVYGKSCQTYWSREMHRIIEGIGGLSNFRRCGIYCVDFTVVRQRVGFDKAQALVFLGRTVAIGNPRNPMAYLTTSRLTRGEALRSSATIQCLDPPA